MTLAIISHPDCRTHDMGSSHPEAPDRLVAIYIALGTAKFGSVLQYYDHDVPLASSTHLARVHSASYLSKLEELAPSYAGDQYWLDGDTCLMVHTLTAAKRAAGAAVLAVELVLQAKVQSAFCAIRPPGHHAGRSRAMGFCYYNNVAVAAYHALEWGNLERIAIVDFDVHHGNGTENIVTGDQRILLCSSFQHPFYPYEGADSKAENICNLPLPAGTNGETYKAAVKKTWLPRLEAFRPQLVLFSAGFDGHAQDGMSLFQLVDSDYAWLTQEVKQIADRHSAGRMISCLEGGYNLSVLGGSVAAHLQALIGDN